MKRTTSDGCPSSSNKKTKTGGFWQTGLIDSMNDPKLKIFEDDSVVVIKDKYPKAKFHYLVLPKRDIKSLSKVTKDELDLLKHMDAIGRRQVAQPADIKKFRFGYHAIPSMSRLHMHVISQDFDSPCLKTKKHWNSFTTSFFRDSSDIIKELEEKGKIEQMDAKVGESYMSRDLKCHKCSTDFSTMPKLKNHLSTAHKVWD